MNRRARLGGALVLLAGLSGCGPVPVAQAERSCLEDARAAEAPQGEIALGLGSGGGRVRPTARVEMSVSADYVMRRDPSDVFARCVMQRSGQSPTRPLSDQPGWRR